MFRRGDNRGFRLTAGNITSGDVAYVIQQQIQARLREVLHVLWQVGDDEAGDN